MKKYSTLLFAVIFLLSCQDRNPIKDLDKQAIDQAEISEANKLFEDAYQAAVATSPMWQTRLGLKDNYAEWDDLSEEAEAKARDMYKGFLTTLKDSIEYNKLDEETALSYRLFELWCNNSINSYEWRHYDYPVNQMHGMQAGVPAFLINSHKIDNEADAKAYLDRLEKLPTLFSQLIERIKMSEAEGVVPPKFVFEHTIRDCENMLQGKPITKDGENPIYEDFVKKVEALDDLNSDMKKQLILGCEKRMMVNVVPAYKELKNFLVEQEKRATTEDGVWKFNKGEDFFKYRLRHITSTDLSAEEIHQIGLSEVERIHGEMTDIMKKVGFEGNLQDFFKFMREDKQFYFPNDRKGRNAYLNKANMVIDSMRMKLDELFHTKPKAELIVKAVEPFREKSAGKAFYQTGAKDFSRPGTYYANLYKMEAMPSYQMEALAYHEAIPGHHMQLSIAQEMESLPQFRQSALRFTAYTEGWGLYSEYIPKEIGFYKDPYSDFGRLAMELWRACRLVVDTGIHDKKWTRQQGIDYYKNNTPNDESDCVKMVERHIVMPGQATAYKIGMLRMIELKDKAEAELGENFDIRDFHDVILTNGPVSLDILEDLVENYISNTKK